MPAGGPSLWLTALAAALAAGFSRVVAWLPALIGAIVILIVGWIIGKVVQALITRGLRAVHFDNLTDRAGINHALQSANVKADPALILGMIGYWFVFLLAINAAIGVLGITYLSDLMARVIDYLPRIFAAILVVVVGAWGASFLARVTKASAATAHIQYSDILGNIVAGAVLFFTFATALDLLGISFPFLTTAFAIILGALALAGAVAFGLGGREYASDVLAGRELRTLFQPGDRVMTPNLDGTIYMIGPTMTTVRTSRGDVAVQNSDLVQHQVTKPSRHMGEGGNMPHAA